MKSGSWIGLWKILVSRQPALWIAGYGRKGPAATPSAYPSADGEGLTERGFAITHSSHWRAGRDSNP